MTLSKSVLEIVNDPNPGVTAVRKHSKEVIISALLEVKRIFSEQALEIRRIDLEMARMNFELKKMEMDHKMRVSEGILVYGSETKEHRYGPKYSGEVSSNLATLWTGSQEEITPSPGSEDNELEKRVETARSQGMRWNLQDKRPERNSTVVRKLEDWESAVDRGFKADLNLYAQHNHKKLMEMEGVCKGFVIGLCMQMEQKMGIGPSSSYLASRYKRDSEKYRELFIANDKNIEEVLPEPVETAEDRAKSTIERIYTEWLGPDYRSRVKKDDEVSKMPGTPHLKRMFEKHVQVLANLDTDESIRDRSFAVMVLWDMTQPYTVPMIKDRIAWGVACQRDMKFLNYADIHQTYRRSAESKKCVDDMYCEWWGSMCDNLKLS